MAGVQAALPTAEGTVVPKVGPQSAIVAHVSGDVTAIEVVAVRVTEDVASGESRIPCEARVVRRVDQRASMCSVSCSSSYGRGYAR